MAKMAGETASRVTLLALGLAALAGSPFGCDGTANGPSSDTGLMSRDAVLFGLLSDVGPHVILPTLDACLSSMEALKEANETWASALANGDSGDIERSAAQEAFYEAMLAWQVAEVHQVGPAAPSMTTDGGDDQRDEIYSWPTVNPCRVDQETVKEGWNTESFYDTHLVNVYGLDAIEYLLFAPTGDNQCIDLFDINSDGTWEALGASGIASHRAQYATALTEHIVTTAHDLRDRWAADNGNYTDTLATAPNDTYPSPIDALNDIFDALFYLETVTKDDKLARPLGLTDCTEARCLDAIESSWSGYSVAWIGGNLDGFERLFTGDQGIGIDDLLVAWGHGDLADRMVANVDNAQALVEGLDGRMDELITTQPEAIEALHAAIKAITDDLKGDLATVLALEIPQEAAGDND